MKELLIEELSIEDKARRYDEALRKARIYYDDYKTRDNILYVEDMEDMFPELKESDDEKIRKELLEQVIYIVPNDDEVDSEGNTLPTYQKRIDKYRAWLEKQGEQKPKFRVGDTIKCKCDDRQFTIKSVDLDKWTYTYTQKGCGNDIDYADECFELVEQKLYVNGNAKEMFIKALERVEEQNNKGYKLTDCDKNSWWEDFKVYTTSEQILANSTKNCEDKQKPIEIKPKFHEGDWVTNKFGSWHIDSLDKKNYQVSDGKGHYFYFPILKQDKMHHWTIKDAKDGDVLAAHGCIVIFKEIDGLNIKCHCAFHCFGFNPNICIDTLQNKTAFRPATKEERDLLFEKMKEDCCEWSNEQRKRINELRKLIKI